MSRRRTLLLFSTLLSIALSACGDQSRTPLPVTPRASPPSPAPPVLGSEAYQIELERWGISNNGTAATETTDGINHAVQWAVANGYARVQLPAGTYLVGKRESDTYTGGIELESAMSFELDAGAVIQMAPGDTWNACVVAITGKHDVSVSGGALRGDRATHTFRNDGADDEGHVFCIQNESERVSIRGVSISEATGDGVLIVAQGAAGSSCKDISISGSHLFDNRRQGVSIVGGERILIENNEIDHTRGTSPQFGIDIESLSYSSRDIIIRGNHFHHNHGGDIVNTDGHIVLIENNVLEEGEGNSSIDGPIVLWENTDQTVRGNTISVTVGSVNGKVGLIGYSGNNRRNTLTTYVEENAFNGCGMYVYQSAQLQILNNRFDDGFIALSDMADLAVRGNAVQQSSPPWAYRFRRCFGEASANTLNDQAYDIGLSSDESFTNYSDW